MKTAAPALTVRPTTLVARQALMRVSDEIEAVAARNHAAPPDRLGQRYDATRFLPEAGNTIICALDFEVPAHAAVLEARARMQALPGAEGFLFTPQSSLHMTVFEGVIETRRTADAWPADMDRAAPVDAVTKALLPRFDQFNPPPAFAVRLARVRPGGLILTGATAADDACMRAWRDALTVPFGYRHDAHDAYIFHMTFAYPVTWLASPVLPLWEQELQAIGEELAQAAPVVPLKPPAFCSFSDMEHFEPLQSLQR